MLGSEVLTALQDRLLVTWCLGLDLDASLSAGVRGLCLGTF